MQLVLLSGYMYVYACFVSYTHFYKTIQIVEKYIYRLNTNCESKILPPPLNVILLFSLLEHCVCILTTYRHQDCHA